MHSRRSLARLIPLLFSGSAAFDILAFFTFDPADASPVANPYTDNSTYLLDVTQPLNAMDMTGGALQIQTNSFGSSFFANRVVTQDTFTVAAGLAQKIVIDRTAGGSNWLQLGIGFYDSTNVSNRSGCAMFIDTEINISSSSTSTDTNRILLGEGEATSGNLQYVLFYVSTDVLGLAKRESAGVWNLLGTYPEQASVGTVKAAINHSVSHGTQDITDWKIAQLAGTAATDYGIVTERIDGALNTNDTYTHPADFSQTIDMGTLGSSAHKIRFREQDSSNYWENWISSAGASSLRETVAGSPTQRATATGAFSGGEVAKLRCEDESIWGWANASRSFAYSSAANFKTATSGKIEQVGLTGALSNLKVYSYELAISSQLENM